MFSDMFKRSTYDLFPCQEIVNDIEGFDIYCIFTGKQAGKGRTGYIELAVTTYIIDSKENLFIRCCKYPGSRKGAKKAIKEQFIQMMNDLSVSNGMIQCEMRYFEVSNNKFVEPLKYNKKLFEIKN